MRRKHIFSIFIFLIIIGIAIWIFSLSKKEDTVKVDESILIEQDVVAESSEFVELKNAVRPEPSSEKEVLQSSLLENVPFTSQQRKYFV